MGLRGWQCGISAGFGGVGKGRGGSAVVQEPGWENAGVDRAGEMSAGKAWPEGRTRDYCGDSNTIWARQANGGGRPLLPLITSFGWRCCRRLAVTESGRGTTCGLGWPCSCRRISLCCGSCSPDRELERLLMARCAVRFQGRQERVVGQSGSFTHDD